MSGLRIDRGINSTSSPRSPPTPDPLSMPNGVGGFFPRRSCDGLTRTGTSAGTGLESTHERIRLVRVLAEQGAPARGGWAVWNLPPVPNTAEPAPQSAPSGEPAAQPQQTLFQVPYCKPADTAFIKTPVLVSPSIDQIMAPPKPLALTYCIFSVNTWGSSNDQNVLPLKVHIWWVVGCR